MGSLDPTTRAPDGPNTPLTSRARRPYLAIRCYAIVPPGRKFDFLASSSTSSPPHSSPPTPPLVGLGEVIYGPCMHARRSKVHTIRTHFGSIYIRKPSISASWLPLAACCSGPRRLFPCHRWPLRRHCWVSIAILSLQPATLQLAACSLAACSLATRSLQPCPGRRHWPKASKFS